MAESYHLKHHLEFNLIIAGIGGQGINSLAKVLAEFFLRSGLNCQFTVHKGGAQSLGSVYAELRANDQELVVLGQGIPKGELDILIALEPWEALRHVSLANKKTKFRIETQAMPLFIERSNERVTDSPKKQLDALPLDIQWLSYQEIALQKFSNVRMANYFAGLECVTVLKTFSEVFDLALYDELFFKLINKAIRTQD